MKRNEKIKQNLELTGLGALIALIAFLGVFFFFFAFFNMLANFDLLPFSTGFFIAVLIGGIASFLFLACYVVCLRMKKSTKFGNRLSLYYPKIILFYLILIIIFISIRSEIIWSYEGLKDTVCLEWTIFGISVTIFLVWDVLILKYLKDIQPKNTNITGLLRRREYIGKKGEFYQTVSVMFNTVTILLINLFVLLFSTAWAFLSKEEVTLFGQNAVIISFYFCTNTIVSLLIDIIVPLIKEKKIMLKETKVSDKDIDEINSIGEQIEKAMIVLKEIDDITVLDEMQKAALKMELINKIMGDPAAPTDGAESENENKRD